LASLAAPICTRAAGHLIGRVVSLWSQAALAGLPGSLRRLAIQYAAQCGRIHAERVETLFRYDACLRMGRFIARLEALCRQAPGDGDSVAERSTEGTWAGSDGRWPLCSNEQKSGKLLVKTGAASASNRMLV